MSNTKDDWDIPSSEILLYNDWIKELKKNEEQKKKKKNPVYFNKWDIENIENKEYVFEHLVPIILKKLNNKEYVINSNSNFGYIVLQAGKDEGYYEFIKWFHNRYPISIKQLQIYLEELNEKTKKKGYLLTLSYYGAHHFTEEEDFLNERVSNFCSIYMFIKIIFI